MSLLGTSSIHGCGVQLVFSLAPLCLDDVWELPAHIADLPSQAARTIGTHYKQPLSVSLAAFLFNRYKEPFRDMRVTVCIGP